MVNFKQWALLLMVGLSNVRADEEPTSECKFSVDATKKEFTGVTTCTEDKYGYYYLESITPDEGDDVPLDPPVFIKVTGQNTYEEVDLPGYYKLVDDKGVVMCPGGSESCSSTSGHLNNNDCSNDLGKYIKGSGVVIGCNNNGYVYKNFAVPASSATKRDESTSKEYYLSQYAKGMAFGFDASVTYYAIKIDETSITFDQSVNLTDVMLDLSTGKVVTNRKVDFCSPNSGNHFYTCTNGKCIRRSQSDYNTIEPNDKICTIGEKKYESTTTSFLASNCEEKSGYYIGKRTNGDGETRDVLCKIGAINTDCDEQENPARGYYWNNVYYNQIIGCDENGCKQVEPIYTPEAECTAALANQIIDTGYSVYYCKLSNGNVEKVSLADMADEINNDEEGYTVNGISGSIFDNAEATYHLTTDDDKHSIKVNTEMDDDESQGCIKGTCVTTQCTVSMSGSTSCSASHCGSTYYDGYRFIDRENKDLEDDQSNGFLLKLDNGECSVVSQVPGFYLNQINGLKDTYPLVYCNENTECRLKKKAKFDVIELGADTDIEYYYLNQEDPTKKPIIICYESEYDGIDIECKATAAERTFYVNGEQTNYSVTRTVIECSEADNVFTCKEKELDGNQHYPNMSIDGKTFLGIIKCGGDECHEELLLKKVDQSSKPKTVIINIGDPKKQYLIDMPHVFINGLDQTRLIYCSIYGDNCDVIRGNKGDDTNDNTLYYIDSAVPEETLGLIKCSPPGHDCVHVSGKENYAYITGVEENVIVCSSDKCVYEKVPARDDGHYLNGGEGKVLIHYKNDGKIFETMEAENDEQIYVNSGASKDNEKYQLILCTKKDECSLIKTINSKEYLSYPSPTIYTITSVIEEDVTKYSATPSPSLETIGNYDIKGFLVNPDTFEILKDNSVTGVLITCNKVEQQDQGAQTRKRSEPTFVLVCEKITPSTDQFYFNGDNSDYKLIQSKDSKVKFITPEVGLYINSGDVINCTTSECIKHTGENVLKAEDGKCNTGKVGYVTSEGKICMKEGEEPVSITGKYIIKLNGNPSNNLYKFSSNTILKVTSSTDEMYLVDKEGKVIESSGESGDVYKCNSNGCTKENATGNNYYINGDDTTRLTNPKIKCTTESATTTCTLQSDASNEIYCLSSAKSLFQCASDKCPKDNEIPTSSDCVKVANPKLSTDNYYYLNEADNSSLIQCTGVTNCQTGKIDEGYYLSGNPSKPLIKCVKSFDKLRCNYETPSNGYYLDSNNKEILQFNRKRDDTIIMELIKCDNKGCQKEKVTFEGYAWYLSSDNLLIKCDNEGCKKHLKPSEGWYVNGDGKDKEGKYLIKCTVTTISGGDLSYSCAESAVINDGYYINAAYSKPDNKKLIKCGKGSGCDEEGVKNISEKKYYVNGVDQKLIYCPENGVCTATVPSSTSHTTWYLSGANEDGLIGCSKAGICKEYESPSRSGYYMNGDPNTSKYPLIYYYEDNREGDNDDKFTNSDDKLLNGWYRNGDLNASNDEKMIRCDDANDCVYVEVLDKKCEEFSDNGFSISKGYLEWCSPDKTGFKLEGDDDVKIVTATFKVDGVIPGVKLVGVKGEHYALTDISNDYVEKIRGEQQALVKITKNGIVSYKGKDGYFAYKDELYECPKYNNGVCLKVEDVKNGYYRNYGGDDIDEVYEYNRNGYGLSKLSDIENEVKYFNDKLYNNRIAAYDVKGKDFPGVGEKVDYILADVNRYAVMYKEDVAMTCNDVAANGKYTKDCVKKDKLEYDYETNNGYYIFGSNKRLSEVYIPRVDSNNRKYKLYCNMNGICNEMELSKQAIVNYRLSEDRVLLAERNGVNKKEVVPLVLDGAYVSNKSGSSYVKIVCKLTGECEEHQIKTNNGQGISIVNGGVKFKTDKGKTVDGIKLYSKYVLQKKTVNAYIKRDEIPDEAYPMDTVLELNYNSYTWNHDTRNIFVNEEYRMITTGNDDVNTGYICKNGSCYEVNQTENKMYYINTVQAGSNINAYVECKEKSCQMMSLNENNEVVLVPNGASTGPQDALIYCKMDKGCEVVATTAESGLPYCKLESYGEKIYNLYGRKFTESGEILRDNQYCLSTKSKKDDERIMKNIDGIYMFDEGFEEVVITKITKDYINASLYYKYGGKFTRTYGYITTLNDGYVKCDKSGCKIIKEFGTCEMNGAGTMISKDKMCIDKDKKTLVPGENNNNMKFYAVSIDNEGSFPEVGISSKIIVGVNASFKFVVNEDGYVLITTGNVIGTNDETGKLYKCTSENMNCVEVVKPVDGIYKNIFSGNAIKCDNNVCKIQSGEKLNSKGEFAKTDIDEYYYIDEFIYRSTKQELTKVKIDNYILLKNNKIAPDFPERASKLYSCNSTTGKCIDVKEKEDGWYISYKGNGNAIYCENTLCYSKELAGTCAGVGQLIYKNNDYFLCTRSGSSETNSVGKMLGNVVKYDNTGSFFAGSDYVNYGIGKVVAVGNTKLSSRDTTDGNYKPLAACSTASDKCSNLEDDEYCINTDGALYQKVKDTTQDSSTTTCTAKEGIVVLYGNKDYVASEDMKAGAKMYNCVKNGTSTSCRIVTGYYDNIGCDYDGCVKKTPPSDKNGDWTSAGKIKVGTGEKSAEEGKYFYITGENVFPGSGNKEGILVQSGVQKVGNKDKKYFIIFKGEGYYLLNNSDKMLEKDEEAGSAGTLYLCNDLVCIKKDMAENGYYLNAKAERGKAIIICGRTGSTTTCKIAGQMNDNTGEVVDTSTSSFNCTEANVGRIVRDSQKTSYNICYGNNVRAQFTGNAATTQYYFMTMKHGNKFADIKLESNGVNFENDTATVLLKVNNNSVTQVNIEGYVLSSSNSILEIASRTVSGELYYCENKAYEYQGKSTTHQCTKVNEKKNGWYFTNYLKDNLYIQCTESQCNVVEANLSNECVGSGSLVYNGGKFKICENEGKQVEVGSLSEMQTVMMNVGKSAEFPSVRSDNTDIMINRSAVNVTLVKMDSYVVVQEAETRKIVNLALNRKVDEASTPGLLYKCENTGSCNKVKYAKDEYYLLGVSGQAKQLIYCENRTCTIRNPAEGFYISADKLKPVIQCIQPGNVKGTGELIVEEGKVQENIVCFERNPVEGWFVNKGLGLNKSVDGLIRCTDEMGCERFDVANGWYLNAGASFNYENLTNKTITDIIKCNKNGKCELYQNEIGSSCTKGGEIIKVGNRYKVCKSNEADDFFDITVDGVEIINVQAKGDFPDAEIGKTAVSIKKGKVVQASEDGYYYKSSSMYYCVNKSCNEIVDDASNDIVVQNVLSKTLYVSACADNVCTWTEQTEEGYYFVQSVGGKTKLYKNEGDTSFANLLIYDCRNVGRELKCNDVTRFDGYMYNPKHTIEGRLSNENLYLKTDSTYKLVSNKLRKCTEFKPNYCYISYENEPYTSDADNYDSTTDLPKDIEAGSVCTNSNGVLYFATKTIHTGLDEENCVEIPRGNDKSVRYQKINVDTVNEKMYLIDSHGARVADEVTEYDGPTCTYDIKTEICKAVGVDEIKAGDYCKSVGGMEKLYLAKARITSTGNSCTRYDGYNNDYELDVKVARDKSKQLYLVNGGLYSINNEKVEKMEEGVYYTDVVNYGVKLDLGYTISIAEDSNYRMYVCNKDGCERKMSCSSKGGFEYLYNGENNRVVKCDPLTKTVTEVNAPGYYLNSMSNDLVKCYYDGNCLEIKPETAMEGYYKDAGNPMKMITCVRVDDEFGCIEDSLKECTYNEVKGTCTSTKDLLRNSYCYYRKEDVVYGLIEKYLYVSKYIKSGTEGRCIAGTDEDIFVKERNSKFIGHEEREDLIRVSSDSIVSVYEEDIGYYLINTKEGKGVVATAEYSGGIPEKKTRFYACRKGDCIEEVPEDKKIYVNKASSKKLVRFTKGKAVNNGVWKVIDNGCRMNRINVMICDIDPPTYENAIDRFSVVYKDQYDAVTLYDNIYPVMGKIRLDYHVGLKKNTFVEYKNDLYLYDYDGQSFTRMEGGPYVFEKEDYNFNLVAYKSNRNETNIEYTVLPNSYSLGDEGYYVNKADMDGLGIVIQKMKVEQKLEPATENEDGTRTAQQTGSVPLVKSKYKAVINKCTSEKQNYCKTAEGTYNIEQGGVCVVTDGEFKGLYLAVEAIKNNSDVRNCIKYEEGGSYKYLDKEIMFSGMRMKNNILKVSKDMIEPFRHDVNNEGAYETGIYVFTETEEKNLVKFNNNQFNTALAYRCGKKVTPPEQEGGEEKVSYACEPFTGESGYYLTKPLGSYVAPDDVMEYKLGKWRNVSEMGYYFFKDNYLPANITYSDGGNVVTYHPVYYYRRVFGDVKIDYNGRYLNMIDKNVTISYESEADVENKLTVKEELKRCTVTAATGVCTNEANNLATDDACIGQDGKLYVVDVIKSEVPEVSDTAKCYTGTVDQLKYVMIGSKLYMLDGMSIKSMSTGYYVFNENMEAFTSKYPAVPSSIIYCSGVNQCRKMTEKLNINQDVLINEAKSSIVAERSLLRYYANVFGKERLMMVSKNGYYCLNGEGLLSVTSNGEEEVAENCWIKTDEGIMEVNGCDAMDICINSSRGSGNVVISDGKSKIIEGITVNYEKGYIQLKKEFNLDDSKVIYKLFNGKLYKLKKEKLEHVAEGLYLLGKDGKAFVETEPTNIDSKSICYYVNGACNTEEMKKYRDHKYVINRAANPPTIVTYEKEKDRWSTVDKDGYYFFFVLNNGQPYSIDPEDRRVYSNEAEVRVKRIVDGKILEEEDFNNGMYVTEDRNEELVVGRVDGTWYDAEYVIENVEGISRRRCSAIEVGEKIDVDEYCYSDKYGICVPKNTITDAAVSDKNCISSEGTENLFYFVNDGLYIANNYSYQRIVHNGLYVIDRENVPYAGKMESDSTAYLCENGVCSNVKELESTYYLNVAGLEVGENIILYYNSESNSWRTVDEDGNYLFNKFGYPVAADEEIAYYYSVSKNGNVVERKNVIGSKVVSKDVSVYSGTDGKAKALELCTIDGSDVTSNATLEVGDLCLADDVVVVISGAEKSSKRQEEAPSSYTGIAGNVEEKMYSIVGDELVLIEKDVITSLNINGYVVVDNRNNLPLESQEEVDATVYKCTEEGCAVADNSEFVVGSNYINSGSMEKYPLVKYAGEGKWNVENREGYYFLDDKMKGVEVGVFAENIYEVEVVNEVLKQKDITEENKIGFFMNKANDKKNVVTNNGKYWSEGKALNRCIASEVKVENVVTGMLCKTDSSNPAGYPAGDYCVSGRNDQIYYLLKAATNETEAANCVFGTNESEKFVFLDKNVGGKLNGETVTSSLLVIDQEGIREAEIGYYIADKGDVKVSEVVPVEEEGQTQGYKVYKCEESGCSKKELGSGSVFQTADGKIYEVDEVGNIGDVKKNGLFFFDVEGDICDTTNNEVGSIINITGDGSSEEKIPIDGMRDGAYINDGNEKYVGIYEDGQWSIVDMECEVDASDGKCSSTKVDLQLGSYCSVAGKFYVVKSIEADGSKKCIAGNDESPVFINTDSEALVVVGEKKVFSINEEEGYYAINDETLQALDSEEAVAAQFVLCEFGGECKKYAPEVGRYINRSAGELNIAVFDEAGKNEASTIDSKCTVEENVSSAICNVVDGTLDVGDVCINENKIYVISSSDGTCLKAEKAVTTYKLIKDKMYMLTEEAVIQKNDGYFFINGENRAITRKEDYGKPDTVGYICSNKGDCYDIEPTERAYYVDYTTKSSKRYNVVKFDPELKSARKGKREGSSGYEAVEEEGIYKLADGAYTECVLNDIDEIECHDIEEVGTYATNEGEIIKCVENDEGEVECSQAIEGGYYVIGDMLMECDVNEDGDKLVCEEMDKEGYFLAQPDGELWECVAKSDESQDAVPDEDIEVSKILEQLNAEAGNDAGKNSEDETTSAGDEPTTTEAEPTTTTPVDEYTPTPVDVVCAPVECKVGKVIYQKDENGVEDEDSPIYVCKNVKDDVNKFETECDSGNYVKGRNGYYICESDKSSIDDEKINKPNDDHTKDVIPEKTTTSSTTTTTTKSEEKPTTTTTKTTQKPATTTTKPTSTPTTAGASSMYSKLPTLAFYLVIFVFSYFLFF